MVRYTLRPAPPGMPPPSREELDGARIKLCDLPSAPCKLSTDPAHRSTIPRRSRTDILVDAPVDHPVAIGAYECQIVQGSDGFPADLG